MKSVSGGVCAPQGFLAGALACGIKKSHKPDLALIYSEVPACAAGLFTTNKVQAAPIGLSKTHLLDGKAQAIIANSGNANACVGEFGHTAAMTMCQAAANYLGVPAQSVLVASTGVIGVPLPVEKIEIALSGASGILSTSGSLLAAQAIMTTDTFAKETAVAVEINGVTVKIGGIAKGSGMIHPNMATMLGFITTDAVIDRTLLKQALTRAGTISFNRVSVDGDTSTNDCLFILANGKAGNSPISADGLEYRLFAEALEAVCLTLAKMLAQDGEGATKLVEIRVQGAASEADAVCVGRAVATSNLVKTALFGEDANWGRILAAVGYSGVDVVPEKIRIYLDGLAVCSGGVGLAFDEVQAKQILEASEIPITVDLGQGMATATIWTCDLSYDYVKINGSYRT